MLHRFSVGFASRLLPTTLRSVVNPVQDIKPLPPKHDEKPAEPAAEKHDGRENPKPWLICQHVGGTHAHVIKMPEQAVSQSGLVCRNPEPPAAGQRRSSPPRHRPLRPRPSATRARAWRGRPRPPSSRRPRGRSPCAGRTTFGCAACAATPWNSATRPCPAHRRSQTNSSMPKSSAASAPEPYAPRSASPGGRPVAAPVTRHREDHPRGPPPPARRRRHEHARARTAALRRPHGIPSHARPEAPRGGRETPRCATTVLSAVASCKSHARPMPWGKVAAQLVAV